jgi:hypothetical protein
MSRWARQRFQRLSCRYKIRGAPAPLVPLGIPILDAVRQRARDLGYSLRELDEELETGKYFRKGNRFLNFRAVMRAVKFLNGQILVEWDSEEP